MQPQPLPSPTPPVPPSVPLTDPDSQISGLIRDLSKLISGALTTYGAVASSNTVLVAGLITGVLSVLWSRYNTVLTSKFISAASALPVNTPRAAIAALAATPTPPVVVPLTEEAAALLAEQLRPHLAAPPPPKP